MICFAWTPVWISRKMLYISEASVFFVLRTLLSISLEFEVIIRLTCAHFLFHMHHFLHLLYSIQIWQIFHSESFRWPVNQTEILNRIWIFAFHHLFSTLDPFSMCLHYFSHSYNVASETLRLKWRWCVFMARMQNVCVTAQP